MQQNLLGKDDHQGLRRFAAMMMWAFPLFFSLLLPWLFSFALQWWPLAVSLAFGLLYAFAPGFIYYPYRGWMAIAGVIGWINTRLILGITFYGMILPVGTLLRLAGKLQYRHKARAADSYYLPSESAGDKERLERPF